MRKLILRDVRPYNGMAYKLAIPDPPRDAHELNIAQTGAMSFVQEVLMALCAPGDLVVDVGVNLGTVAIPLALRGMRVVGYDVSAENLEATAASARANDVSERIELREAAVWHQSGTVPFNGGNSLFAIAEGASSAIKAVALSTEFGLDEKITAIKVDVEGCEINVFRGAEAHLKAQHPHLVFEVYPYGMATYGTSARQLMIYLEGLGYQIYRITQYGLVPGYDPPAEQLVTDYIATVLPPDALARHSGLSIRPLSVSQMVDELELQDRLLDLHRQYSLAVQDTLPDGVRKSARVVELMKRWEAKHGRDRQVSVLRSAVYG